jgi:hypothetical protein
MVRGIEDLQNTIVEAYELLEKGEEYFRRNSKKTKQGRVAESNATPRDRKGRFNARNNRKAGKVVQSNNQAKRNKK